MSTYASRTFQQAFDDARAIGLLNDTAKQVYTDAVLLPHGAKAFSTIQRKFAERGLPFVETTTESLTYTALAVTIVVPVGVTDLSAPLEIWEKGGDDSLWVMMQRIDDVGAPVINPGVVLGRWEWRNGTICVPACSEDRDIFCRYRRQLAYPAAGDPVGFDGVYDALVSGTAFFAATARPDVQAAALSSFKEEMESAVHIASRDRQGIVYRQQGWRGDTARPRIRIDQS